MTIDKELVVRPTQSLSPNTVDVNIDLLCDSAFGTQSVVVEIWHNIKLTYTSATTGYPLTYTSITAAPTTGTYAGFTQGQQIVCSSPSSYELGIILNLLQIKLTPANNYEEIDNNDFAVKLVTVNSASTSLIESTTIPTFDYQVDVDITGSISEITEGEAYNFTATLSQTNEHKFYVYYDIYFNGDVLEDTNARSFITAILAGVSWNEIRIISNYFYEPNQSTATHNEVFRLKYFREALSNDDFRIVIRTIRLQQNPIPTLTFNPTTSINSFTYNPEFQIRLSPAVTDDTITVTVILEKDSRAVRYCDFQYYIDDDRTINSSLPRNQLLTGTYTITDQLGVDLSSSGYFTNTNTTIVQFATSVDGVGNGITDLPIYNYTMKRRQTNYLIDKNDHGAEFTFYEAFHTSSPYFNRQFGADRDTIHRLKFIGRIVEDKTSDYGVKYHVFNVTIEWVTELPNANLDVILTLHHNIEHVKDFKYVNYYSITNVEPNNIQLHGSSSLGTKIITFVFELDDINHSNFDFKTNIEDQINVMYQFNDTYFINQANIEYVVESQSMYIDGLDDYIQMYNNNGYQSNLFDRRYIQDVCSANISQITIIIVFETSKHTDLNDNMLMQWKGDVHAMDAELLVGCRMGLSNEIVSTYSAQQYQHVTHSIPFDWSKDGLYAYTLVAKNEYFVQYVHEIKDGELYLLENSGCVYSNIHHFEFNNGFNYKLGITKNYVANKIRLFDLIVANVAYEDQTYINEHIRQRISWNLLQPESHIIFEFYANNTQFESDIVEHSPLDWKHVHQLINYIRVKHTTNDNIIDSDTNELTYVQNGIYRMYDHGTDRQCHVNIPTSIALNQSELLFNIVFKLTFLKNSVILLSNDKIKIKLKNFGGVIYIILVLDNTNYCICTLPKNNDYYALNIHMSKTTPTSDKLDIKYAIYQINSIHLFDKSSENNLVTHGTKRIRYTMSSSVNAFKIIEKESIEKGAYDLLLAYCSLRTNVNTYMDIEYVQKIQNQLHDTIWDVFDKRLVFVHDRPNIIFTYTASQLSSSILNIRCCVNTYPTYPDFWNRFTNGWEIHYRMYLKLSQLIDDDKIDYYVFLHAWRTTYYFDLGVDRWGGRIRIPSTYQIPTDYKFITFDKEDMFWFDITFDFKQYVYTIYNLDDIVHLHYGRGGTDGVMENVIERKINWDKTYYMTPNQLQLTVNSQTNAYFEIMRLSVNNPLCNIEFHKDMNDIYSVNFHNCGVEAFNEQMTENDNVKMLIMDCKKHYIWNEYHMVLMSKQLQMTRYVNTASVNSVISFMFQNAFGQMTQNNGEYLMSYHINDELLYGLQRYETEIVFQFKKIHFISIPIHFYDFENMFIISAGVTEFTDTYSMKLVVWRIDHTGNIHKSEKEHRVPKIHYDIIQQSHVKLYKSNVFLLDASAFDGKLDASDACQIVFDRYKNINHIPDLRKKVIEYDGRIITEDQSLMFNNKPKLIENKQNVWTMKNSFEMFIVMDVKEYTIECNISNISNNSFVYHDMNVMFPENTKHILNICANLSDTMSFNIISLQTDDLYFHEPIIDDIDDIDIYMDKIWTNRTLTLKTPDGNYFIHIENMIESNISSFKSNLDSVEIAHILIYDTKLSYKERNAISQQLIDAWIYPRYYMTTSSSIDNYGDVIIHHNLQYNKIDVQSNIIHTNANVSQYLLSMKNRDNYDTHIESVAATQPFTNEMQIQIKKNEDIPILNPTNYITNVTHMHVNNEMLYNIKPILYGHVNTFTMFESMKSEFVVNDIQIVHANISDMMLFDENGVVKLRIVIDYIDDSNPILLRVYHKDNLTIVPNQFNETLLSNISDFENVHHEIPANFSNGIQIKLDDIEESNDFKRLVSKSNIRYIYLNLYYQFKYDYTCSDHDFIAHIYNSVNKSYVHPCESIFGNIEISPQFQLIDISLKNPYTYLNLQTYEPTPVKQPVQQIASGVPFRNLDSYKDHIRVFDYSFRDASNKYININLPATPSSKSASAPVWQFGTYHTSTGFMFKYVEKIIQTPNRQIDIDISNGHSNKITIFSIIDNDNEKSSLFSLERGIIDYSSLTMKSPGNDDIIIDMDTSTYDEISTHIRGYTLINGNYKLQVDIQGITSNSSYELIYEGIHDLSSKIEIGKYDDTYLFTVKIMDFRSTYDGDIAEFSRLFVGAGYYDYQEFIDRSYLDYLSNIVSYMDQDQYIQYMNYDTMTYNDIVYYSSNILEPQGRSEIFEIDSVYEANVSIEYKNTSSPIISELYANIGLFIIFETNIQSNVLFSDEYSGLGITIDTANIDLILPEIFDNRISLFKNVFDTTKEDYKYILHTQIIYNNENGNIEEIQSSVRGINNTLDATFIDIDRYKNPNYDIISLGRYDFLDISYNTSNYWSYIESANVTAELNFKSLYLFDIPTTTTTGLETMRVDGKVSLELTTNSNITCCLFKIIHSTKTRSRINKYKKIYTTNPHDDQFDLKFHEDTNPSFRWSPYQTIITTAPVYNHNIFMSDTWLDHDNSSNQFLVYAPIDAEQNIQYLKGDLSNILEFDYTKLILMNLISRDDQPTIYFSCVSIPENEYKSFIETNPNSSVRSEIIMNKYFANSLLVPAGKINWYNVDPISLNVAERIQTQLEDSLNIFVDEYKEYIQGLNVYFNYNLNSNIFDTFINDVYAKLDLDRTYDGYPYIFNEWDDIDAVSILDDIELGNYVEGNIIYNHDMEIDDLKMSKIYPFFTGEKPNNNYKHKFGNTVEYAQLYNYINETHRDSEIKRLLLPRK
tara:strand:- start:174 stop:8432 length:8259 start_codon:yes stop_codon:yes gene_type:complete